MLYLLKIIQLNYLRKIKVSKITDGVIVVDKVLHRISVSSYNLIYLFELADKAIVVNPNSEDLKIANERGWEVIDD